MAGEEVVILVMVICCFCFLVAAAGGGYYYYYYQAPAPETGLETTDSLLAASFAAAPSPAAISDPKMALVATATKIQEAELDTQPGGPFTFPTPSNTASLSYTLTTWIWIQNAHGTWRNVFCRGADGIQGGGFDRRPALFITGNDMGPANRLHFIHSTTDDNNKYIIQATPITLNTWTHVAFLVDNTAKKITTYINGVKDTQEATLPATASFLWDGTLPGNNNNVKYNVYFGGVNPGNGPVKIKQFYFFDKILAVSDIATLAAAPAPAPTTSSYLPEPYESEDFMRLQE